MHEFGNLVGSISFDAYVFDVDVEYEEYIQNLTRAELEAEHLQLLHEYEMLRDEQ